MVFHPPMLYMGYVGMSVAFAFAIAALLGGKLDAAWARWSRPWTTMAWCFLTLRHRARKLVGVLRTGLGRLVVLGPGGKRLVHALAGRHRADSLAGGDREARQFPQLDRAAGDLHFLAVADGHIPRSIRRADIRACLRDRSPARCVHPRLPRCRHRLLAGAVRMARADVSGWAGGSKPSRASRYC